MSRLYRFVILDDDEEHRRQVCRALFLQFPGAVVKSADSGNGIGVASEAADVMVVHQKDPAQALAITRVIRKANAHIPVLFISPDHCVKEAFAAGATRYLTPAQSARISSVVVELLAATPAPESPVSTE